MRNCSAPTAERPSRCSQDAAGPVPRVTDYARRLIDRASTYRAFMLDESTACYRHADQRAAVSCQRCERPICTECMTQASVGFHCPACLKSDGQRVIRGVDIRSAPPKVVIGLIVINVLIYLAQSTVVIDGLPLQIWGGVHGELVLEGEWWRVITGGFLHGGLFHIGFNMMFLWVLGGPLERGIGSLRLALLYLIGLLGGSLAVVAFAPTSLTVGASGAVLGLAGASAAIIRARGDSLRDTPFLGLVLMNLALPLIAPGISFWGHAGGAAAGFVAGWILATTASRK